MLGIFYMLLCLLTGLMFCQLALPGIFKYTEESFMGGKKISVPSLFVVFPASLLTGTLLLSWPAYFLAYVMGSVADPLLYADYIVMGASILFIIIAIIVKRKKLGESFKGTFSGMGGAELIVLMFAGTIAVLLMVLSFYYLKGNYNVGLSVFSDFSTHIDMIRSFSNGDNFPTTYSHFAGEDIKYHFMFQFFVGNLEHMGLRLDLAFNIPSILFFICVCMLLYTLAVKLFTKKAVGVLAVFLFLFRSSRSFFDYIAKIPGKFSDMYDTLEKNTEFIGSTANENWGLYNLNVYANQRHLALGLTMLLLAILILMQNVFDAVKRIYKEGDSEKIPYFSVLVEMYLRKEGWLVKNPVRAIAVGLIIGMCAFFNGACVIACLMVLFFLAFIADRRFEYLLAAIVAVGLSFAQTRFFITSSAFSFRWEPGYLAEVKTLFGSIDFLISLLGISVILVFSAALIVGAIYRWILFSFTTPIIFAMCFQLTTDTAVNHKYIMKGCMLLTMFIAAFVYYLYSKKELFKKFIALVLIVLLTITGVYDLSVFIKRNSPANSGSMKFSVDDPVTKWVMENSNARDIWLTDWYSLNNLVFGGAMLYYGWPYYAWSAGYDTDYRSTQVKAMYEAASSDELRELVSENNIRFIVVDNSVRNSENYRVNENVIAQTFGCVYSEGDGEWAFRIFDTKVNAR
ncbi:MAG: hypothetical protein IKR27_04515 [Lachnospiraceae bacterium]|nr:hypothetical protein [Lachnospiraceae bacterium]